MQQIFTFSGKFVDMVYGRGWLRKCWTEMGERHTMRRCVRRHVLIKHVILGRHRWALRRNWKFGVPGSRLPRIRPRTEENLLYAIHLGV